MKQQRHRTADEMKIAHDKTFDHIQKQGMTPEQRKAWDRKPYQLKGKNEQR